MAYTQKEKEQIKFDYESGRYDAKQVSKTWKMSQQTLKKFADENGWVLGRRNEEIGKQVECTAADILIRKEAHRLVEYIEEHLKVIGIIDDTYKILLAFHIKELKESGGLILKADGDKWVSNYKALQIAIDSFDKSFRSKRLAMGLKETDAPNFNMNFNLNKIENVSELSDKEINYIIAHEGDIESTDVN